MREREVGFWRKHIIQNDPLGLQYNNMIMDMQDLDYVNCVGSCKP